MIKLHYAILVLALSSCATAIPLQPKERCALDGMILKGITHNELSGSAYNPYVGVTESSTSGESISCAFPEAEADRCEMNRTRQSMGPKLDYNRNIGTKRFWNGLGYYAFIVPGVVLKIVYDDKKADALEESSKIAQASENCQAPIGRQVSSDK